MRTALVWIGLSGLWAGCGDDAGAILVLSAPDGPEGAARLEIVLASAAEDAIARDVDQRIAPDSVEEAPVTYYRQRASGGDAMAVEVLDGFSVRIEPELAIVDDAAFIPFLLVRDEQDEVIAVGTVDDAEGSPYPIDVLTSKRVEYVTTVRPVASPSAKHALAVGKTVRCASNAGGSFTSGVVWRPESGPELRLLFADRRIDPTLTDATDRPLDLDCDDLAADDGGAPDCDDIRAEIRPGAFEQCDGIDADCDGEEARVVPCELTDAVACSPDDNAPPVTSGVSACVATDDGPPRATTCVPGPSCECPDGSCFARRCELGIADVSSDSYFTCSPAMTVLYPCEGASCTYTIQEVDPRLEVSIAAEPGGPFADHVTGEKMYLLVEDLLQVHPLQSNDRRLGSAIFTIDDPATSTVRTVVLRFVANDAITCGLAGETHPMSCAL